ncbi:MAG: cell division ATPase MinD [Candidatus Aenigmatarchaeota archaeon]|jgi:septum site-determining protein MinD
MARIISIFSSKGGVGKTTLTTNLGLALSSKFNKKVTLIDCNLTSSHLSLYLGIFYSPITLNKVLRGEYRIEEAIQTYQNMQIIPASLSAFDLEGVDMVKLPQIISSLDNLNDFIILDSAPGLGREALSALKASREVLFVTMPLVSSVLDIVRAQEVLRESGIKQLGIVLNMVRNASYEMRKEEIEQLTGLKVLASIPYDNEVYRSAALKQPIVALNPKSKVSKEIFRLAAFIAGIEYLEKKSFIERIGDKFKIIRAFRF